MDWTTLVSLITAFFSAIAAVLAWAAKLRWSKEYAAAKDEVIKAKESQIELLKIQIQVLQDLSPVKIREYFVSVKTQLEEYIDLQKNQIKDAETELSQKEAQIDQLRFAQEIQRISIETEMESGITSTLEGWVRSISIRQDDAEGHSERVVEMTVTLAIRMGISKEQIIHIQRGALLHDIGKMKVPESILSKPGNLTEDEWKILRKHPEYAYELLSPIEYLRPALDIPRFHHEKWDGTGSPNGIKGTEIPLAARIFAIVDVWDAIRTDRLYRAAWPVNKALEYIRGQSGKAFDPQVVDAFITFIQEGKSE
jgi:HD-GYP domain-containing protein (c-di-GMP phosphodiesterase class II)